MKKNYTNPPKLLEELLRRFLYNTTQYSALGDYAELYDHLSSEKGRAYAVTWYCIQLVKLLSTYCLQKSIWSIMMFKNYMKIAFRNINRNKTYTFLNLFGLSIGMAVFSLIFLYVQYELSFDKYHENSDRIYRIVQKAEDRSHYIEIYGSDIIARTHAPLAMALADEFPEVISAVRINFRSNILLSTGKKKFFENKICFADPSIFEVFSFKLINGDPKSALSDPNSIILSERMVDKYFQDKDPIGKVFTYNNSFDLKVTGVMKNIPENSHFTMEFIISFKKYDELLNKVTALWDDNWHCWTYCVFHNDVDIKGFEKKLIPLAERASNNIRNGTKSEFLLQPITSIHLNSHLFKEIDVNSDIKYVYILISIAFLILVIACLNYINLTTACSLKRSREVGIRKVVGAHKRHLVYQFFGESIIITVFALILSTIIFFLALPAFNSLVDRDLSLDIINNSQIILVIFVLLFIVGILAGSYPALFISSYKPIMVLKNAVDKSFKGIKLRNILVTAQFSISILLIICTLIVKEQLYFINNKDIGYEKDRIIVLHLRDPEIRKNIEVIKTELLNNPAILKFSSSSSLPNNIDTWKSIPASVVKERGVMFRTRIDYDFLELYGIEIIEGRNFSRDFPSDETGAVIINETAAKMIGLESPLENSFELHTSRETKKIIGVVRDFHFRSLHKKIDPLYLYMDKRYSGNYLSVKIKGDRITETISLIKDQFEKISLNYPVEYYFFDETINASYNSEQKIGKIFSIFALIAVSIACLGLLGLSIFSAEQRKKEIAVRKTLGAKISGIVILISRDFLRSIFISVAIAWPVGYFAMNNWLQNFAYRIDIGINVILYACFLAVLTAVLTVIWSAIKSATTNPVDSLRYE
ncbi:ABC transporter permease [candidate division KSB1 bacterium]